ncbi:MAG: hypothetical protein MUD14_14915 [Hydrococcus sp. Prado102]|nr:hypothetical protein [Hydrococcus sp. Prado102]
MSVKVLRQFYCKYSLYLLPVIIVSALMAFDFWLGDPVVTAYILLFLSAYVLSRLEPPLTKWLGRLGSRRLIATTFFGVGAVGLVLVSPVLAQSVPNPNPNPSSCQGMFGPISTFFSQAFTSSGATQAGTEVCTTFGMIQAILAGGFIVTLGVTGYVVVAQGAEIRTVLIIPGVALLVFIGSFLIQNMFLGTGTTAPIT